MVLDDHLRFTERLPSDPTAAWRARDFLIDLSLPEGAFLENALLLVSEIVSNAVKHAPQGAITLLVDVASAGIRVAVTDPGGGEIPHPAPPRSDPMEDGYGLFIVNQLADDWGVSNDGTTTVWFDLRFPGRARD